MDNMFDILMDFVGADVVALTLFIGALVFISLTIAKGYFSINKRYIPFIAVIIGLAAGLLSYPFVDISVAERVWAGVLGGFVSIGSQELITARFSRGRSS